ncbi:MAG: hypothetical protein J6J38_07880 [Lachnospiraceae bacterium]|nr:hypothetical protein [Lachnospiraceae bacterium]
MGKISANGVLHFLKSMHAAGAVYLWGANCEVITEELLESLKDNFGKKHYEKVSLEQVEGKIGADCSGLAKPLSGVDYTAAGYYASCEVRGKVSEMPRDRICLLFRRKKKDIAHMAFYTGDGMLYEMWDGCDHKEFVESEWTEYGIPAWIEEQEIVRKVGAKITTKKVLDRYRNAENAKAGKNALEHPYAPGTFYIYKIDPNGAVNISKTKEKAGSWVML